jgi:hypothetical protein
VITLPRFERDILNFFNLLKEFPLNILKFIITKEGNTQPMAGKLLLTESSNGSS